MSRRNIFLIDLENVSVSSLDILSRGDVEVHVFMGEACQKVSAQLAMEMQALGERGRYIRISGNGPNALDFHIAYYLGEMEPRSAQSYFHIISKDTGFDPLVVHLRSKGWFVARSPSIGATGFAKVLEICTPRQRADYVAERLKSTKATRPVKESTLANYVNTQFQKKLSDVEVREVIRVLQQDKIVSITDSRVAYCVGA